MRVLIVDDHKVFAEAVRTSLERGGDVVVALAANGREALEAMEQHADVDVVLMDLGLPNGDGIATGAELLAKWPATRIIAVTALTTRKASSQAMSAGFSGYLSKDLPLAQFVAAVREPDKKRVLIPRRSAGRNGGPASPEERHARWLGSQLTGREREVLALLVEGKSSEGIARSLGVSPNTVRSHVQNILIKLHVHSRLEAVSFAVRYGLVRAERRA